MMLFEKEKEVVDALSERGCFIEENPNTQMKKIFYAGLLFTKVFFPDLWEMLDYIGIIRCEKSKSETYRGLYGIHQEFEVENGQTYHVILIDVSAFECGESRHEKADFVMQVFLHELAHFASWDHNDKFFEYLDYLILKFNRKSKADIRNTYNTDGM